jgi:hypothetical protein
VRKKKKKKWIFSGFVVGSSEKPWIEMFAMERFKIHAKILQLYVKDVVIRMKSRRGIGNA